MNIVVIGAGAWGTALAIAASRAGHAVQLYARDALLAQQLQAQRENSAYLPGHSLPVGLVVKRGHAADAAQQAADLYIIATPMAGLADCLTCLRDTCAPLVWLCKGFDAQGQLGHEIARLCAPQAAVGLLSGPSFAQEVALGQPTALVAASTSVVLQEKLVAAFHSNSLRIYGNSDVIGVEVGGAVKNVLAIATGLCDGLALGLNARAALLTRGLAEMTRLGVALGAKPETFMGLTGLGDLVLTATGNLSRNRQVGLLLAQGLSADQATASLGHVAEGVRCAQAVAERAKALGVDMPIARCVAALLAGQLTAQQAIDALMARQPGKE